MAKEYSFSLSRPEKQSHIWKKTIDHYKYLLSRERVKNDGKTIGAEDTAFIRGKISLLKELIALDDVEIITDDSET